MSKILSGNTGTIVLSEFTDGINVVQGGTPLKFVNYFDGMLMRAELMKLEQQGMHNLSQLSNQAGGHGVVWGYDTALQNGSINLGAGMAIDLSGRVVYMPAGIELDIEQLLQRAEGAAPKLNKGNPIGVGFADCVENESPDPVTVIEGTQYYVITVGQLDALCGEEDVYGKLCEEACITSTDRPYKIDGVVIRVEPLPTGLVLPQSSEVTLSGSHTRSRIASAFYEYEQNQIASHISGEGLAQGIWCNGARLPGGYTRGVPVALLARNGNENLFLDRWIVARERMEAPPRRYWAHVMAMRPWNMFLAQVLQFQCQLNNLFGPGGGTTGTDPCDDTKAKMRAISDELQGLIGRHQIVEDVVGDAVVEEERAEWLDSVIGIEQQLRDGATPNVVASNRILISGGIVETPSAGYLPINIDDEQSVNEQVRALMGEGVDLRFCAVRPDFIPHALEEAQHMERISLLEGLDNPDSKPKVDVLVPDGLFGNTNPGVLGTPYEMKFSLYSLVKRILEYLSRDAEEFNTPEKTAQPSIEDIANVLMMDVSRRANATVAEAAIEAEGMAVSRDENQIIMSFDGAGRGYQTESGGYGFFYAGSDLRQGLLRQIGDRKSIMLTRESISGQRSILQLGLWMSMSIKEDLSKLSIGQFTTASMEFDLASLLASKEKSTRIQISATNISLKVIDTGSDYVEVEATGRIITSINSGNGRQVRNSNMPFNNKVHIKKINSEPTPGTIISTFVDAIFSPKATSIAVTRLWQNTSSARVEFGVLSSGLEQASNLMMLAPIQTQSGFAELIASADQTKNLAVIQADHPAHEASILALDVISSVADQPQLSASRAQQLFDQTRTNTASQLVYATRDWALFHRRRDKQCEVDAPVVELAKRNYRVFTLQLKEAENLDEVLALIKEQTWQRLSSFGMDLVTNVEFDGGTPNMLSSRQRVLSEWKAGVKDTTEILYGTIINNPDWNEPASLAKSRIVQANSVFDDETIISSGAQFEAGSSLPSEVSQTGDGGIIYLVYDVPATCQRVLSFPPNDNAADVIARYTASLANALTLEETIKGFEIQNLGSLNFRGESFDVLDGSEYDKLQQEWQLLDNGPISAVLSICQRDIEKDATVSQADYIAQKLGGDGTPPDHITTQLILGECWGLTFLIPGNVSKQRVFWLDGVTSESAIGMINEAVATRGVESVLAERWVKENNISFDSNDEVVNARDISRLSESIINRTELGDNVEWRAISVTPKQPVAALASSLEKQSELILSSLNDNPSLSVVNDIGEILPDGAGGITLLVAVDTTIDYSVIPVSLAKEGDAIDSSTPQVLFHFDANNELIKNEFFETQIKKLKKLNVELSTAELVGERKPAANDKRLTSLFAALKENEILKPDARKKTTKLKVEERKALDFGSFRLPAVLVLRRA